jgi:SAM-dependent methyltransferase
VRRKKIAAFSSSSRNRLTARDLARFAGATIFDRIGRAVCDAGCLPRKELFEAWETARRVRRLFRGGRVVDLGAGHGLLAYLMLVLDDTSPRAVAVDRTIPPCSAAIGRAVVDAWPRLAGRVDYIRGEFDAVDLLATDIVVSVHACGRLTDIVLERAAAARARVAVLPCCHDTKTCSTGALAGWLDPALAIDVVRARALAANGYRVWTQTIPGDVTPKNRLLIGQPRVEPGGSG